MLMNRAFIEFDARVVEQNMSEHIKLINTIHDATYILARNTPEVIAWINKNLIECMEWQEHPLLQSDIKLGAELDIGLSWDKQFTIPNKFSLEGITNVLEAINTGKSSDEIKETLNENKM